MNQMKISRIATALLAVALMAFLATDVMAQRGGGRPGGGGGQGGPGGRGGGPGGGPGGRGGGGFGFGTPSLGQMALGLLRVEEVRAEVELMPDQEEALKKMGEQGRPERPDFNFQEASEEERQEFFAKMQKQREEQNVKMQEQLEEILLPDQFDRLQEIAVQVLDVNALTVKEVTEELKMSESQSEELKEVQTKLRDEMRAKMGEIFQGGGGGDRDAMREKFAQLREENNKKVLDVLTSEQRSDFEKMKGEKFEIPEGAMRNMFGGGRGGRGGGPGGGAGGRGGRGGGPGGGEGGERQRRRPEAE